MRVLSFINLAGLLALGVLCVAQWQDNRQLNQEINRLETIRIDQAEKLDDRDRTIGGQAEDLKILRDRLVELTESLKVTEGGLRLEEHKAAQLTVERDQLKESVKEWAEAVSRRDDRIRDNQIQIQEIAENLNETVLKYNDLAARYNESVDLLNERTAAYNQLVQQSN